ncbi:magnesium transporter CorA family protein [Planococcus sp. FY231025]|uniref:magnesium transporter CorA family protein n=1 Tax=Planococcus sp. FY231025 TaxID=3455699 RepID=UPI003F92DCD9
MENRSFYGGKWKWIILDEIEERNSLSLYSKLESETYWHESLKANRTSSLYMDTAVEGEESMWGSIIYHQDIEEHKNQSILHYYLEGETLITNKIEYSLLYNINERQLIDKMESAENAIEGFMILLGEVVASFLQDIDEFEDRMHELLWRIKIKNDKQVLDNIMGQRHEVLVWKNLMIPIIEIRDAVPEVFGEIFTEGKHHKRTSRRIMRCRDIIQEYDTEIREIVDLETVIVSYRGNEIVKTLTIITVMFTPIAAWGALWGMNFENMPELKWKYGYAAALTVIAFSTLLLYFYLKKKKWMGSVLQSLTKENGKH